MHGWPSFIVRGVRALLLLAVPATLAAEFESFTLTGVEGDRSHIHQVNGIVSMFEERSIDMAALMQFGVAHNVESTLEGLSASSAQEPASLISPVYEVPIEQPAPWLDVVAVWKLASSDAHDIAIHVQGSVDGITWTDWLVPACSCCAARKVEQDTIVSQLASFDAATRYVRFRVLWTEGAHEVDVQWVKLHFISPGATPTRVREAHEATETDIGVFAIEQPSVVTRVEWGCEDGAGSRWTPSYATFTHLTVHHTVTPNNDTDWAARVRSIWTQHAISQNWGDIGYHFLIGGNGVIYQGRSGALTGDPIAAHVGGHNTANMGVSLMGDFTSVQPTAAARDSLIHVLAWKADQRGIDPFGTSLHVSSGRLMTNIVGHRDWAATQCPGNTFYPTLQTVRDDVDEMINGPAVTLPTAATLAATQITATGARLHGEIVSDGGAPILERRFDWGVLGVWTDWTAGVTVNGDQFHYDLGGLQPETTYNFRAWARNSEGWHMASAQTFTTESDVSPPDPPVALAANDVAHTTYSARWQASAGATNYLLDVSMSPTFTAGDVDYVITFETDSSGNKGTYASGTVDLNGTDWDMTEALIGSLANDWKNGSRSARMRGYGTSSMTMLEDEPDGLGSISFYYRRYGTDTQVDWRVEYSTNSGSAWTRIGADFTAPASDTVQQFSETVNVSGTVRVRIKRATEEGTADRRLNMDDMVMTPYPSAAFLPGYEARPVGNVTAHTVTGLVAGADYFYRLRAENGAGVSAYSSVISVSTPAEEPAHTTTTPVPVPHAWLFGHFGEVDYEVVAMQMTDSGMRVWQEYVAGTDPIDPQSRLAAEVVRSSVSPHNVIQWMGTDQPNRAYTLYWSTNLTSMMNLLQADIPSAYPAPNVVTDSVHSAYSPIYYRIEVTLEE